MKIISDVHGKWARLAALITDKTESYLQIGDLGIGFSGCQCPKRFHDNFKWIRGNHDNPKHARNHPNYLGEYGYLKDLDIFYVSGAWSIDKYYRIEGLSWWSDEELSYPQLQNMLDLYNKTKPGIMITHDCPISASFEICKLNRMKILYPKGNKTSSALEEAFKSHQPKSWIHGHWHIDLKYNVPGMDTEFICLEELGVYDLPGLNWSTKTNEEKSI